MNKILISLIIALACISRFAGASESLFNYDFNSDSVTYVNQGRVDVMLEGIGIHQQAGAPGSGVSGKQRDRAWDASANTTQGVKTPSNNTALIPSVSDFNLAELEEFTLQFWFKTQQSLNQDGAVRLFMKSDRASADVGQGLVLRSLNGRLELRIGGTDENGDGETFIISSRDFSFGEGYNQVDQWVFVAITWDGNHVFYYVGDTESPLSYAGGGSFPGKMLDHPAPFTIGNSRSLNRGLDGWIDNFRFFDVSIASPEIEEMRKKDLFSE